MKNAFKIEPSTNMMDVLGHSGYTFDSAIADIIDNSISANAKNITIYFDLNKNNKPYLYILDDGIGMNNEKIHQCIVPAYEDMNSVRRSEDLGRYSLGLKSASKSFCDQLYVCSKEKNGVSKTVELDFVHIKKSKKWEAFEIDNFEFEDKIGESGTLIFWNNVNFKSTSARLDNNLIYDIFEKLQLSISHTFGKYILNNKINIFIQSSQSNKNKVKGWDPFDLPENKTTKTISNKKLQLNNKDIFVTSYILPTYTNLSEKDKLYMRGKGLIEQQGFYVYRNDRLIQEGGWLELDGVTSDLKFQYARIEVRIGTNLDEEFDVNFSKSKVIIPEELKRNFLEIAKYARKESRHNHNYLKNPNPQKRIKKDKNIKVWNAYKTSEGLKLSINTAHPLIDEIISKLSSSDAKKLMNLIATTIPINMIQTQGGLEERFEEDDIKQIMEDAFKKIYDNEKDLGKIKKIMFKTEPFNMYVPLLVDFFNAKEEEINEKDR